MTVCPKCKFYRICGGRLNETVENCARFKSVEQTNEEWLDRKLPVVMGRKKRK